jgi:flagellar biosynthesis protein FlhA
VLVLQTALEQEIMATFDPESASRLLGDGARSAPAGFLRRVVDSVKRLTAGAPATALPVLLVPSPARYHMRRWLEPFMPKVTVISPGEIPPEIRVRSIGTIG